MNKKTHNYLTSNKFIYSRIVYGFFTRNGGISKKPFNSLNCCLSNGDNENSVNKNIFSAKKQLGLEKTNIKFVSQVHSTNIEIINTLNYSKKIIADGMINQHKDISLAILTADCAPIFLIDLNNEIICAIHSGWKGCLNNIFLNVMKKLKKNFKFEHNLVAIVGPCLDQANFEVDQNFKQDFLNKNLKYKVFFKEKRDSRKLLFNMRGLIEYQLKTLSINNIFHVDYDTYSEKDVFFSHRRAAQNNVLPTGRMVNIIGFKQ